MHNEIIRWGIIGAGDVAEIKSGPAFYKTDSSELLAVMRRNSEKAQDFAQRHNVPYWYDDAKALLANPDINAIYIATPPAQHKEYAIAALAAGKNIYIEKPITLNAQECREIIAARKQFNHKSCVAHYRRFLPCFIKVAELITEGAIGRPLLARLDMLQPARSKLIANSEQNWRVEPALSGGGLFHDLAPHQLDLMLHWFGPISDASGFATNQQKFHLADDCVIGWGRFNSGIEFQGRWHFAMPENIARDECEIIGSSGRLTINFFGEQVIKLFRGEKQEEIRLPNPKHIQQPMIEAVNAYFRGARENPCSLEEGLAVMELMDRFTVKRQ
jgi:1,5-anhydro-D-fructose reductase (1,5-anhydro-D-mannitol-forming)